MEKMNDSKLFAIFICVTFLSLDVLSAPATNSNNKSSNATNIETQVNKDPKSNSSKTNSSKSVATKSAELNETNKTSAKGSNSQSPASKVLPKTDSKGAESKSTPGKKQVTVRTNKGTEPVKTKKSSKTSSKTTATAKVGSSKQSEMTTKKKVSNVKQQTRVETAKTQSSKANTEKDSSKDLNRNAANTQKSSNTKSVKEELRSSTNENKATTAKNTNSTTVAKETNLKTKTTVVKHSETTTPSVEQAKPTPEKKIMKQTKPISQEKVTKQIKPTTKKIVMKQSKPTPSVKQTQPEEDDNVITTTTTTEATVTDNVETVTSWDGLPCSARFRAHPVDKTKFEVAFAENLFAGDSYQSCPSTLVWRQDQCMCGWMDPEKVETCNCCGQGLKSHKSDKTMYMRLVNGDWLEETCNIFDANQIWDNEKCNCVWDPNKPQTHKASVFKAAVLPNVLTKCMNLVNMTLDEGLKDSGGRDLTPLFGRQRIRVVDEKGDVGKSVEIRRAPFKIGIFNGNDLQSTVYFKFNFKVHPDQVRRRKKMVIMSNGCKRRWQRKVLQPSLEVAFFPYNETFEVQFSTTGKTIVEYIKGTKDANGWYQCVLYLQDRKLNLEVNGQKVYSTNGMSGRVRSTDCPLTVAGSPVNAKHHFDGYIDELQVVKQCKYESDVAS